MKTKYIGLVALLGLLAVSPSLMSVKAADYHDPEKIDVNEILDKTFANLEDTDMVLEMPEGGFLFGQAFEYDVDNQTRALANYDSESDPNSVTVAEAKEILKKDYEDALENDTGVMPYGAAPPTADRVRTLAYGAEYYSAIFTGRGWRFSDVQWKPIVGSGDYLKWSSLVDSGRVGSYGEAYATYTGNLRGTFIGTGTYVWNSEGGQGQVYFTLDPIPGTQYFVANVD